MVAVEVLSVVLSLAVLLICRFGKDDGSGLAGAIHVLPGVFYADLQGDGMVGNDVSFCDGEAAFAGVHLNAVVCDAQPDGEAEGFGEPLSCDRGVGIAQDRDDGTGRNRAVGAHGSPHRGDAVQHSGIGSCFAVSGSRFWRRTANHPEMESSCKGLPCGVDSHPIALD